MVSSGALLLWVLRLKSPSIRLTAWTAMLFGSLAIPVVNSTLPNLPVNVREGRAGASHRPSSDRERRRRSAAFRRQKPFDWSKAAVFLYALVAAALLLRVVVGLAISLRLLRASREADRITERYRNSRVGPRRRTP